MTKQTVTARYLYDAYGWSGCAGSSWDNLSPATREGWEFAAKVYNEKNAGQKMTDK